MKKIFLKSIKLSVFILGLLFLNSCEDESVTGKVQSEVKGGAVLRTISVNSSTFNFFDTSSKWSITLEEQDSKNGELFSEIKIYLKHTKAGVTSNEVSLKSIPASSFIKGVNGYPRGTIEITLNEALTALGLTSGGYTPSDKITVRLDLVLTDGRVFSSANKSPTVGGSSYFASPFQYSIQFFCPLTNAADFNGAYEVVVDAWADYAPGDEIPVVYNPADGAYSFRVLASNNLYLVNKASAYLLVTIDPVTGAVTVTSNEDFNYGGGDTTPVTGTGSVGTCTGDINLKLNFPGFSSTGKALNLIKK